LVCPSCGSEVREGAKFCNQCGTALALACPTCGEPYQPGQKFCEECGTRLTEASTPASEPGVAPAPEMRMVSVLFVDLVGFTSLSEKREAEDVRELLGRYFDSTRTIIERHGGVVEKFIGDAVMAVWGAPVAREDDAERAVRTALEVVDAVSAFGEEVGAPDLRARAGVVTGQVAALESPGEGLVVGDRVNTASRVQSAAAPGTVFVDEVTRQASAAAIAFEDVGEHSAKGKAEPLRLWRALAADVHRAAGRERDAARLAGSAASALGRLGRHAEAIERVTAALRILGAEQEDAVVAELNQALGRALSTTGEQEAAAPHLETALRIAQALKLPKLLSQALTDMAALLMWTGRAEEAHYMFVAAVEIAERNDLSEELQRALGNSGWLGAQWDRPEAVQQLESGMGLARRRGQPYAESVCASNLMMIQLLRGQWRELERLAAEVLENGSDQTFDAEIHHRLAILHALRGDPALARTSLDALTTWERTDDTERQMAHATDLTAVLLAEGRLEEALEQGQRILAPALDKLAAASEHVRQAWPDTLQAAISLGRMEDARRLVALLLVRPPGHIPPYLEAHLARARALIDAAEAHQEAVEPGLRDAMRQFAALGYPYWLAVAQTDLAEWLIGQGRATEADQLLADAVPVLSELAAGPALERAASLRRVDSTTVQAAV
jgi:class 3 adenylate cyclase